VKKAMLILLLILILLSLLSTGTLALYTKTRELRGSISTRVLILNADEKPVSYELGLSGLALMPGESNKDLYRFELTNAADAYNISDYAMTVSIRSKGMAQAIEDMSGLVFMLYDAEKEGGSPIATISGGELSIDSITFAMGVRKTLKYRLTATWNDTGASAEQSALASSGKIFPIQFVISSQTQN